MTTENKKISVKELQTFIEAVEFAADTEEWIPSARQWKRIRSMIDNLETEVPARQPVVNNTAITAPAPVHRAPDRPVMMAPPGMPPPTYTAPPAHTALPPTFANPNAPGVPAKTPDIDTSAGGYNSSFA